jgi:hypothetical protein
MEKNIYITQKNNKIMNIDVSENVIRKNTIKKTCKNFVE